MIVAEQALSDVKVLDLTWYIAGPYCTKLLADYGADVIKVERPGTGDRARTMGPFLGDDPHPEKSGLFLHLNTNKRSITLNLKTDTGRKLFKELAKDVDVLVENFSPHVMPSLGLGYEELEKLNPRLVMTSISNFGQTGPYRDYKASELIIYGMGGDMYFAGVPDREPMKKGGRVVEYQGGIHAACATMVALFMAREQGIGQHVDVSLMETQMASIDRRMSHLIDYQYNGPRLQRLYPGSRLAIPVSGIYPCKDGYFAFVGGMAFLPRVCKMIGRPELAEVYGKPEAQTDPAKKEEFEAILIPWLLEHTKKECTEAGQAVGELCGPVNNTEDLFKDPHWRARGYWEEVNHPVAGRLTYPGAPAKMLGSPWQIRRPAPLLGQHNEEVYGALGYSRDDLVELRDSGVI